MIALHFNEAQSEFEHIVLSPFYYYLGHVTLAIQFFF